MLPLVTIGIPFYNSELFIKNAIQSVINQTYKNWELILIDDGSTDKSLEFAKEFVDPRITIYSDNNNLGLIVRLNQIIFLAKGKFIARMDSDDVMHFERIETQVNYMLSNPACDVLATNYYVIDKNNKIIGDRNEKQKSLKSKLDILKFGGLPHPTVMGKQKWFQDNLYDVNCNRFEDFELWYRTVSFSNFHILDKNLFFYRSVGIPTFIKYKQTNDGIVSLLIKELRKYNYCNFLLIKIIISFKTKNVLYKGFQYFNSLDFIIKMRYKTIKPINLVIVEETFIKSIAVEKI